MPLTAAVIPSTAAAVAASAEVQRARLALRRMFVQHSMSCDVLHVVRICFIVDPCLVVLNFVVASQNLRHCECVSLCIVGVYISRRYRVLSRVISWKNTSFALQNY